MYACGWHDLKLKTIVSNIGTTLRGSDSVRLRHKLAIVDGKETTIRHTKLIKRPRMIEEFFDYFSVVDVHDHLRQGSLAIEESWKTKTWAHRVFATVFGIILTDCYLAYKMEKSRHTVSPAVDDFATFLGKLTKQMIENDPTRITRGVSTANESKDSAEVEIPHQQCQLIDHQNYSYLQGTDSRPRIKCKVDNCKFRTGTYCVSCSTFAQLECRNDYTRANGIFGVCSTTTGRQCYAKHLEEKKVG